MGARYPVRVKGKRPAAAGLVELDLDVSGTPVAGSHTTPGQYVEVALPGTEPAFFAIASAPGEDEKLELLLRLGSELQDALAKLPEGAEVEASVALGRGFPLERAKGRDVLLFATGSGISAVRSLVLHLRANRNDFGRVKLYFGVRTPDAFAYARDLDAWTGDRIDVVRTVSRPGQSGWAGLTGYVQSHLKDDRHEGAVAFLCGQPEMVEGVTEALLRSGVRREDIHLNY